MKKQKSLKSDPFKIGSDALPRLGNQGYERIPKELREARRKNENVEKLLTVFASPETKGSMFAIERYLAYFQNLKQIKYTKEDIETICNTIEINQHTGLFLSAAINQITKEEDTIRLNFNGRLVDFIGFRLPHGTLIIEGNTGESTGDEMSGGKIQIQGNTGSFTGDEMSGGKIQIHGNAGRYVGYNSKSGTIRIEGTIESIDGSCKAKVYQKRERVK